MLDSPYTTHSQVMRVAVLALLARGVRVLAVSLDNHCYASDVSVHSHHHPRKHDHSRELEHRVERCDAPDAACGLLRHATRWLVDCSVTAPVLREAMLLAPQGTVFVMCGHAMLPGAVRRAPSLPWKSHQRPLTRRCCPQPD
jgi:hypothetical protein